MTGGRKNLKRAAKEKTAILQQGQSIMQVVDLRGSNLIEVALLFQCSLSLSFYTHTQYLHICMLCLLHGSKLNYLNVKVMDANGEKSLAIFPAKFQKSMWIKRGLLY